MTYQNTTPYSVRFSETAQKLFDKLDKPPQEYIMDYLRKNVHGKLNPREYGKALQGGLKGSWRYTIGSYRAICDINDETHIVYITKVSSRGSAYKK